MMRRGAACVCLSLLPGLCSAAQWQMVPRLALAADVDSNRRLRLVPRESEGGVLGGALTLARLTEVSTLAFVPRAAISRYSGEDALDSEDWGADLSWRRNGPRTLVDAQAGYADQNTLATELGETGFVDGNTRRYSMTASTSLTQFLATRHTLGYQLAYSNIDYDRTLGTGLIGYRYPSANINYSFSLSPRLDTTLSVNAARLTADIIGVESDTRGVQAGLRYRFSENFDVLVNTGAAQTSAGGTTDTERTYRLGVNWRDEVSSAQLSVSRDVAPSGRGVLVNADDLRLAYSRRLTERWSLDLSLRGSRRQAFSFDRRPYDYTYAAAGFSLNYALAESWSVNCAGGYARQDYELSPGPADGQRFGISLTWKPLQ